MQVDDLVDRRGLIQKLKGVPDPTMQAKSEKFAAQARQERQQKELNDLFPD